MVGEREKNVWAEWMSEGGASALVSGDRKLFGGEKCKPRLYNYHSFTIGNGLHLRLEIEYSDFNALNLEGLINC